MQCTLTSFKKRLVFSACDAKLLLAESKEAVMEDAPPNRLAAALARMDNIYENIQGMLQLLG